MSNQAHTDVLLAEPDDALSDQFSELGESLASSSASLNSSILRYREENGRTYHSFREGKYVLPNDQAENDRLDLQHHLFFLTFEGKLFTCPAGKNKPLERVLDLGCGTGIWSLDFADDHPDTQVIGVDLSPIQPQFVAPNVQFYIDDIEDEWTWSNKFDFIYGRMLTGSIADWPKLLQRSFDNLNPGGYLEIADILLEYKSDDNTIPPGSVAAQWGDLMIEAAEKFGRPLDSGKKCKKQLEDAGFVNVTETVFKWPAYSWPKDPRYKELGMWCFENLGTGASGLSMALFTRALGWAPEEVEVFAAKLRTEFKDRTIHGWWPIYVLTAQKPE